MGAVDVLAVGVAVDFDRNRRDRIWFWIMDAAAFCLADTSSADSWGVGENDG